MSELAIYDGLTLIGITRGRNGRCEALAVPGERMIGVFPTSAKAASAIHEEYSLRQKAQTPKIDI